MATNSTINSNFVINSISFINFVIKIVKFVYLDFEVEQEVEISFCFKQCFQSLKYKFHLIHVDNLKVDWAFRD